MLTLRLGLCNLQMQTASGSAESFIQQNGNNGLLCPLFLSVRYFSDHAPECCPEGSGWDELHDPDCVRVQHRPD